MQDRIIRFIVDNSGVPEQQLREMMFRTGELVRDVGTVLIGEEAVRCGLIDELGGLGEAVAVLRQYINNPMLAKSRRLRFQPQYQQPYSYQGYNVRGGY